jgi:hypothetical protein
MLNLRPPRHTPTLREAAGVDVKRTSRVRYRECFASRAERRKRCQSTLASQRLGGVNRGCPVGAGPLDIGMAAIGVGVGPPTGLLVASRLPRLWLMKHDGVWTTTILRAHGSNASPGLRGALRVPPWGSICFAAPHLM